MKAGARPAARRPAACPSGQSSRTPSAPPPPLAMPPLLEAATSAIAAHPLPALAALATCAALFRLARFATADDADGALLGTRPPRAGAYARRTVWVTGASQGLGLELAVRYAALGAHTILSARPSPRLDGAGAAVAAAAAAAGAPPPTLLPFDARAGAEELGRVAAAAAAAAEVAGSGPGPDLLVLCAGASQHAAASATDAAVSDALFELNCVAPVRLVRAALPGLLAAVAARQVGGAGAAAPSSSSSSPAAPPPPPPPSLLPPTTANILSINSMAALIPAPGQAAYGASKAGLAMFLATLACELGDKGVRASVFLPGPIATGSASAPRAVYGSGGPKALPPPSPAEAAKRLSPGRCA